MLVKNVLNGLKRQYDISDITVLKASDDQGEPKYHGSLEGFMRPADYAVKEHAEIMNSEVIHRWVRARGEAHVFIVID